VETILVWTLIIAAVAIVAMLAMLIAAERDLQRQRAETETLRAGIESASRGRATAAGREDNAGAISEVSAELSALREQLQASQAALANKQAELDQLRAENGLLGLRTAGYRGESSELMKPAAESDRTTQHGDSTAFPVGHPPNQPRIGSQHPYAAMFAVLVLVGGASLYFNGAWRDIVLMSSSKANDHPEGQPANTPSANETASVRDSAATPKKNKSRVIPPATTTPSTTTSYQIIRSTRVFSEPNESSRPVARVDAGTEISVVATREEWLEVRSRHGRPPGFIRKDAAVMK
jgi:hypothetical protein